MDTSSKRPHDYLGVIKYGPALQDLNKAGLSDLQFKRTFDPLMCRILQLDALLCRDGMWDPDRAGDLRDQITARQDDLEILYRAQGLLLEEYC